MHRLSALILLLQVGSICGCSDKRLSEVDVSSVHHPVISTADSVVSSNLSFLDSVVAGHFDNNSGYSLIRIQTTMEFIEELTEIASVSDGTYFGRIAPDVQDLLRWKEWFTRYRDCLIIDTPATRIYIDSMCWKKR